MLQTQNLLNGVINLVCTPNHFVDRKIKMVCCLFKLQLFPPQSQIKDIKRYSNIIKSSIVTYLPYKHGSWFVVIYYILVEMATHVPKDTINCSRNNNRWRWPTTHGSETHNLDQHCNLQHTKKLFCREQ